jgi:hypothetical protein
VKTRALEVPPPGVGLKTVTWAVPATAISEVGISAVNRVEETNVVVRFAPFQRTTELPLKPLPLIVSVNADPPAVRDDGFRLEIVGTGLLIVSVSALEAPPPGVGVNTVTWTAPATAMSEAAIAALTRVEETKVVA